MYRLLIPLAACLLLSTSAPAQIVVEELPKLTQEEEKLLAPYLTKDGFLTGTLEVRDELTAFGTFYGTIWRIEPNGSWTITRFLAKNPILIGKGQLSKRQIREVAQRLLPFDPLSLVNIGEPLVNPHVITVSFGPNSASWILGVDQLAPIVTLEDLKIPVSALAPYVVSKTPPAPKGTLVVNPITRFAGIETIAKGMIQPNLGVQLDLPERLKQLGHP